MANNPKIREVPHTIEDYRNMRMFLTDVRNAIHKLNNSVTTLAATTTTTSNASPLIPQPITTTLPNGAGNLVVATPDGTGGTSSLRALVLNDIAAFVTTDGTLVGNSDLLIPTEKAVKTYVDAHGGSGLTLAGVNGDIQINSGPTSFDSSASGASASNASSLTYSHTVGVGLVNGVIIIGFSYYNAAVSASAVTYGGVACTRINRWNDGSHAATLEVWYCVAPLAGANNVIITLTGTVGVGNSIQALSMSFSGIDQVTVWQATTNIGFAAGATSISDSITLTNPNAWVVDFAISGFPSAAVLTPNAGQTQPGASPGTGSGFSEIYGSYKYPGVSGATTLGWTIPATNAFTQYSQISLLPTGARNLGALPQSTFLASTMLDTDGTLAANSDTRIASQKATKTYADAHGGGGAGAGFAYGGDGSDAALNFDGTNTFASLATTTGAAPNLVYSLIRDIFATTVIVAAGIQLKTCSFVIHATVSVTANGTIRCNGTDGSAAQDGFAGSIGNGGAGGASGNNAENAVVGALPIPNSGAGLNRGPTSIAGGNSSTTVGAQAAISNAGNSAANFPIATAQYNPATWNSGKGGTAGANAGGALRASGANGAFTRLTVSTPRFPQLAMIMRDRNANTFSVINTPGGSPGGGAGGGDGTNKGGGGGGGGGAGGSGGYLVIAAPTITIGAAGAITSNGGNGTKGGNGGAASAGTAAGGGGGGGGCGGNGGIVALIYHTLVNGGTISATHGTGGGTSTGGNGLNANPGDPGAAGVNGTDGIVIQMAV